MELGNLLKDGFRTYRSESSQLKNGLWISYFYCILNIDWTRIIHFIIRWDFSVRHPDFSLSPESIGNVFFSLLSGEAPGCIFYRNPMCSLSVVRNLNNKHTPSDILLLMFILHTFMGALSKSKMCWKWSKDLTESPHYYYHYYCLKISPLTSSGLVKCLTYIFIQDKVSHNVPLGKEKISDLNIVDV